MMIPTNISGSMSSYKILGYVKCFGSIQINLEKYVNQLGGGKECIISGINRHN